MDALGARALLDLEQVDRYRFRSVRNLDNGRRAIFGGQPIAQGLAAARRTIDGWPAHNVSGQYLRAGAPEVPVDYRVEPVRDGRRYASRRVLASQNGRPIFDMLCAFHDPEDGPRHQYAERPASPPPDALESTASFVQRNAHRLPPGMAEIYTLPFPVELRPIDPEAVFFEPLAAPKRDFWLRMPSAAEIADPLDHQALLAFLSDYWLAGTVGAMHVRPGDGEHVATVTLNHNLWFHAPVRADAWLLHQTDSPWAGDGRGLARGLLYDEDGRLVATTAQEISIRPM
jgi:acyl-CoA thioesterase-2